jgi:hypothetical protein
VFGIFVIEIPEGNIKLRSGRPGKLRSVDLRGVRAMSGRSKLVDHALPMPAGVKKSKG